MFVKVLGLRMDQLKHTAPRGSGVCSPQECLHVGPLRLLLVAQGDI